LDRGPSRGVDLPIAMQKVVGSNPFNRLFADC